MSDMQKEGDLGECEYCPGKPGEYSERFGEVLCEDCLGESEDMITCDVCDSKNSYVITSWLTGEASRQCNDCGNKWM